MPHTARRLRIPPSRALVLDILHFARRVPTCANDRYCDVSPLVPLRGNAPQRISWPAILLKAFALTVVDHPRFRQTWMPWPWPHIYQHDRDIATLVVHRRFEEDDWLFWGRLRDLSAKSLVAIQAEIDHLQTAPVEQVFKRQLWLARRAWPIRRAVWWHTLHYSGAKKCSRLGTYYLSTVSGSGAEIQAPPSVLTSGFTFGPINDQGITRVTVTYDHRLMDGQHVARVLEQFDRTLQTEVASELELLHDPVPATRRGAWNGAVADYAGSSTTIHKAS